MKGHNYGLCRKCGKFHQPSHGKLKKSSSRMWTDKELSILVETYSSTPLEKMLNFLPSRTRQAIRGKACELKIRQNKGIEIIHRKAPPWNKGHHGDPRILASISHASSCRQPETWKMKKARLSCHLYKRPTAPERKVQNLLNYLNILAIPQYPFNGFHLDFALPEEKLAILVDGCYWHCCPIHFPMATTKTQQHNLTVDKKRERILKRAGWRTLHIWEHEVSEPAALEHLRKLIKEE